MLQKICRICPSTSEWRYPTPKIGENVGAYTSQYGFGFEEWLNREEWLLSGYPGIEGEWRYAHIQGMTTKKNAYVGEKVRILFYVKEAGYEPQAVGILENGFIIDVEEATWVAKQMAKQRWLHRMHAEVEAIGGDIQGLPSIPKNKDKLTWENPFFYANVRFKPEDLHFFDERKTISVSSYYYGTALNWDGVVPESRYYISPVSFEAVSDKEDKRTPKELARFSEEIQQRRASAGKEVTPRQAPIQNALAVQLADYYGPQKGVVTCEDERVDIKLVAPDRSVSFIEIKPASTAKQAIRLALGQLLEYSHYPNTDKAERLIIVSDVPACAPDLEYIRHINKSFNLSVRYIYWPPKTKTLPDKELIKFTT